MVGTTRDRVVLVVEGGGAVALVVGAGGGVVVVGAVDGATVVSDSIPLATDGGGVRSADSSTGEQPPRTASPMQPSTIERRMAPTTRSFSTDLAAASYPGHTPGGQTHTMACGL